MMNVIGRNVLVFFSLVSGLLVTVRAETARLSDVEAAASMVDIPELPAPAQVTAPGARSVSPEVRVVYLVPTDKIFRPEYVRMLSQEIAHLQSWYFDALGTGKTFNLHTPTVEVYHTTHDSLWYRGAGGQFDFFYGAAADGFAHTGGSYYDPQNRWVFYVDAVPADGQCGGCGVAGVAVIGYALPTEQPLCGCSGAGNFTGVLGHELGHAFGLPHPPECDSALPACYEGPQSPYSSLMFLGYSVYPCTYFLSADIASLAASPFFLAQPRPAAFDCERMAPQCGDGERIGAEECDDGGNLSGDGCSPACTIESCVRFLSTDVPQSIPDLGIVTSTLSLPSVPIYDLNVVSLSGSHTFTGDLEFHLISPAGTDVMAINRQCEFEDDFALDLDDSGTSDITCPMTDLAAHRPSNRLASFRGEDAGGTWSLRVFDRVGGDTGTLNGWGLELCVDPCRGQPDDSDCDDANECTGPDVCAGGVCVGAAEPQADCSTAVKSQLSWSVNADETKDKMKFKWTGGPLTQADFSDPTTGNSYTMCVYDGNGLVARFGVPPGGNCDSKPCWVAKDPVGYKYKDKNAGNDGIKAITLKGNSEPKAQVSWQGKSGRLPNPTFGGPAPIVVQTHRDGGVCTHSSFSGDNIKTNSAAGFSGKAP